MIWEIHREYLVSNLENPKNLEVTSQKPAPKTKFFIVLYQLTELYGK